MEKIILEDILPILVIMALGFACGKLKFFDDDQRQGLNKVVLNIALPAALFSAIVKATRDELASDVVLTILSIVGIVAMFMLCFFLCRLIFKHNIQEAAVCALVAGSPTIGFLGFAVLDPIYGGGAETSLVIGIVSIVVNAITIPIGYYLINLGQSKAKAKAAAALANGADENHPDVKAAPVPEHEARAHEAATGEKKEIDVSTAVNPDKAKAQKAAEKSDKKKMNPNVAAILNALKQPVCWAPLLAVVFVLIGIRIPDFIYPTFDLIAKANSGVAVLAAGIALSTVKFSLGAETIWNSFFRLILTPAVFLVVGLLLGMGSNGDQLSMLVMAVALPPAFSGIIISSRYNIYVKEAASTTAVSTVLFAATCVLWVWLVPVVVHMF